MSLLHLSMCWVYFRKYIYLYFLSCLKFDMVNSLWPSDAIWRQRSGSTLAQVMVAAWQHQAITWTNFDLSSVESSAFHVRAISLEIPQLWITKISLKNDLPKIPFKSHRGQWVKSFPTKDLSILQSQYHGSRWPGDERSQGISSHSSFLVITEYSGFSTRNVNSWMDECNHGINDHETFVQSLLFFFVFFCFCVCMHIIVSGYFSNRCPFRRHWLT